VLFVDIREFTPFSQQTHPDEVFRKLNLALAAFADQVAAHGGIVNKFLGDGLMAIFGAPLDDPDHALKACRAALGIAQVAASLRDSGAYPELRIGVGLHCGEVVVGDVGGVEHREYTAIGDVVNVSARVEAATKEVGAEVLVTDEVLRGLTGGVTPGRSFRTRLRGHDQELVLHELVACVED
jgi:adenylate cyclase